MRKLILLLLFISFGLNAFGAENSPSTGTWILNKKTKEMLGLNCVELAADKHCVRMQFTLMGSDGSENAIGPVVLSTEFKHLALWAAGFVFSERYERPDYEVYKFGDDHDYWTAEVTEWAYNECKYYRGNCSAFGKILHPIFGTLAVPVAMVLDLGIRVPGYYIGTSTYYIGTRLVGEMSYRGKKHSSKSIAKKLYKMSKEIGQPLKIIKISNSKFEIISEALSSIKEK